MSGFVQVCVGVLVCAILLDSSVQGMCSIPKSSCRVKHSRTHPTLVLGNVVLTVHTQFKVVRWHLLRPFRGVLGCKMSCVDGMHFIGSCVKRVIERLFGQS